MFGLKPTDSAPPAGGACAKASVVGGAVTSAPGGWTPSGCPGPGGTAGIGAGVGHPGAPGTGWGGACCAWTEPPPSNRPRPRLSAHRFQLMNSSLRKVYRSGCAVNPPAPHRITLLWLVKGIDGRPEVLAGKAECEQGLCPRQPLCSLRPTGTARTEPTAHPGVAGHPARSLAQFAPAPPAHRGGGHRILRMAHAPLSDPRLYEEEGPNYYRVPDKGRLKDKLLRRLQQLGYAVTVTSAEPVA